MFLKLHKIQQTPRGKYRMFLREGTKHGSESLKQGSGVQCLEAIAKLLDF